MKTRVEFDQNHPLVIERVVNWGDMDAFQHVNNTVYFRYFEDVRIAYFERIGALDWMASEQVGPILGHTESRFLFPLTYPDSVLIGTRVGEILEDRFVMHYAIWSQRADRLAAEGTGRIVYFDYQAGRKCPIPEGIRTRL